MNRAAFLDRDGVVNRLVHRGDGIGWDSPSTVSEFELLPGAGTAINEIRDLGLLVVIVSNQPGVAKGTCSPGDLELMDQKMRDGMAVADATIDAIYYCVHHPDGIVERFTATCACRKPQPGLLMEAASDHDIDLKGSYMVGDRLVDMEAGKAAGCTTLLVTRSPVSPGSAMSREHVDHEVSDIAAAAARLRRFELGG